MQLNAELLARDRNHPSVFIWSLCNESDFGYGFERSHEWMRQADPSRPNGGSYDRGSLEMLARHNPITIAGHRGDGEGEQTGPLGRMLVHLPGHLRRRGRDVAGSRASATTTPSRCRPSMSA